MGGSTDVTDRSALTVRPPEEAKTEGGAAFTVTAGAVGKSADRLVLAQFATVTVTSRAGMSDSAVAAAVTSRGIAYV
jgi:hypothetical protein